MKDTEKVVNKQGRKQIHKGLFLVAFLLFCGLLLSGTTAFAGATWLGTNGPNWNGTNWVQTGDVILTNPHHHVCMSVSVPDGPNAGSFTFLCSGTSSFNCTISGSSVSSSSGAITWQLSGHSSNSCGGNTVGGPSGTFALNGTSPTAVTLSDSPSAMLSSNMVWVVIPLALLLLGVSLYVIRRNNNSYLPTD